jgi:hypothetical protein
MTKRGNAAGIHGVCGALFAWSVACSTPVFADTSPALDRASLWVGGFYSDTETRIGASDRSGRYSGSVGLEDDLGFRRHKAVPRARLDFLIGEHQGFSFDFFGIDRTHSRSISRAFDYDGQHFVLIGEHQGFSFDFFGIDRTHSRSISRAFDYDGQHFDASARVDGKLNFNFGSAAYRWWFGSGNDVFGFGVGAAYYGVKARVAGEASLDGQTAQAEASSHETAWAPVLQLGWRHAFTRDLRMYFDAYGVKKNGGNLAGHIYNAALGLEWFPIENLGIGGEYGYTRIKLEQNRTNYRANLDMKLKGPSLFVRLRF